MGFHQPRLPDIDPEKFLRSSFQSRLKYVSKQWGEWGFGAARKISLMYLLKLFGGWFVGGAILITLTSMLNPLEVDSWWTNPIVYQKFVVLAMLFDAIGIGGSWGPLAGKFGPYTGGILFWSRPGTIKMSPYKWIPFTGGNRRTLVDVFLYWGFLFSLATVLLSPGRTASEVPALERFQAFLMDPSSNVPNWLSQNAETFLLIQTTPLIFAAVFLLLIGLRDKIIFLAARSEQYLLPLVFFIVFPNFFEVTDMVIAIKIFLVTVWVGAGFSKLNRHFGPVIPPMIANTPFWPPRWLKKKMFKDFDNDNLLPSPAANFMAHGPGTIVEIGAPLTMLFVTGTALGGQLTVTLSTVLMVMFSLFIISTFPVAVPLEWNLLFALCASIFFIGYPNSAGFSVFDMSEPWMPFSVIAIPVFFVIFGSLRPDKVSFLAALRQYGGNWATGVWAIHPDAEKKLHRVYRPTKDQIDQFQALGMPFIQAEAFLEVSLAWRSLHTQGRGLFSILFKNVPDIDYRRVREGEFACNAMIGFNFGEGHFHDEELIAAIQEQAQFEPGEFVVAWAESEALWHGYQEYKFIDAALGVVERGRWQVKDAAEAQPWLPDGPIPLEVTWRSPEYHKLRFTATDLIGPDAVPAPAADVEVIELEADVQPVAVNR